ncbi:MAG TPA: sigma-70 family RNA polymerase sigma factor [Acidimicrobiales bacterium]|nr:sigma-70 family RNA polymerase sigma factor [Acidimicrobiales bacterium]
MVRRSRTRQTSVEAESDGELTARATEGDTTAFEALYRRHADSAWRLAFAVTGNADDAADAVSDAFTRVFQALPAGQLAESQPFRPYLLAATRNAAIDTLRRGGRTQPTATMEELDSAALGAGPPDRLVASIDMAMIVRAFLDLPERWRSVLWLTEVEGIPAREAGPMLGLTPNAAAQLAVRARAGLRERFLQAHLRSAAGSCTYTVERLGAYVAGALAPRDVAKVDQHLAGCAECRARQAELEDLGGLLRRVAIPLPLALGAVTLSKFKLASAASAAIRRVATGTTNAARVQRPLAALTTAMIALGVISLTVVHNNGNTPSKQASRPSVDGRTALEQVTVPTTGTQTINLAVAQSNADQAAAAAAAAAAANQAAAGPPPQAAIPRPRGGTTPPPSGTTPSPPTTQPPQPAAQPVVQAGLSLDAGTQPVAGAALGLGGNSCVGLQIAGTNIGCPPPAGAPTKSLTVDLSGSLLGDTQIAL